MGGSDQMEYNLKETRRRTITTKRGFGFTELSPLSLSHTHTHTHTHTSTVCVSLSLFWFWFWFLDFSLYQFSKSFLVLISLTFLLFFLNFERELLIFLLLFLWVSRVRWWFLYAPNLQQKLPTIFYLTNHFSFLFFFNKKLK